VAYIKCRCKKDDKPKILDQINPDRTENEKKSYIPLSELCSKIWPGDLNLAIEMTEQELLLGWHYKRIKKNYVFTDLYNRCN